MPRSCCSIAFGHGIGRDEEVMDAEGQRSVIGLMQLYKRERVQQSVRQYSHAKKDDRGSNYVRLENGKIAMIDFENVVKITGL